LNNVVDEQMSLNEVNIAVTLFPPAVQFTQTGNAANKLVADIAEFIDPCKPSVPCPFQSEFQLQLTEPVPVFLAKL